jgi:chitin disaccharide deacetylase
MTTNGSRPLGERLGYAPDAKLLILSCEDVGSSLGANLATYDALRNGAATSASLMVPCPWARDAAAQYAGEDIGIHLTLNAEWDTTRWGPITQAPSLLDGDGGFPRTVEETWDHADLDEVRRECRAQVERAMEWGFDVTHLDSHQGTLVRRAEFFDVYLELALEFNLPIRVMGAKQERLIGFPHRDIALGKGLVFPDEVVLCPMDGARPRIEQALAELRPGVTEFSLHPAVDGEELRALDPDWKGRVKDHTLLTENTWLPEAVEQAGAVLIGFRELRDLQRA